MEISIFYDVSNRVYHVYSSVFSSGLINRQMISEVERAEQREKVNPVKEILKERGSLDYFVGKFLDLKG